MSIDASLLFNTQLSVWELVSREQGLMSLREKSRSLPGWFEYRLKTKQYQEQYKEDCAHCELTLIGLYPKEKQKIHHIEHKLAEHILTSPDDRVLGTELNDAIPSYMVVVRVAVAIFTISSFLEIAATMRMRLDSRMNDRAYRGPVLHPERYPHLMGAMQHLLARE
ncbi:MAG: hypothetical protein HY007_00455 [Candidatus Sungbacteria bacterium]|nr:hypothetical protein [Candidatus Sungbacteria bacterium]